MFSRRQFLGGVLAAGATGCASNSTSVVNLFSETISAKEVAPSEYPLTPSQIRDIPYASLGVRIGTNPKVVMILAEIDAENLQWVSADRVVFVTSRGRLIRTSGLGMDLVETKFLTPTRADPLRAFQDRGALPGSIVRREMTVLPGKSDRQLVVESRFEFGSHQTIVVQGVRHSVRQLDEICVIPAWRWETRNSYWIDTQSARVWRSLQQFRPEIPPIELELLKPAAV